MISDKSVLKPLYSTRSTSNDFNAHRYIPSVNSEFLRRVYFRENSFAKIKSSPNGEIRVGKPYHRRESLRWPICFKSIRENRID